MDYKKLNDILKVLERIDSAELKAPNITLEKLFDLDEQFLNRLQNCNDNEFSVVIKYLNQLYPQELIKKLLDVFDTVHGSDDKINQEFCQYFKSRTVPKNFFKLNKFKKICSYIVEMIPSINEDYKKEKILDIIFSSEMIKNIYGKKNGITFLMDACDDIINSNEQSAEYSAKFTINFFRRIYSVEDEQLIKKYLKCVRKYFIDCKNEWQYDAISNFASHPDLLKTIDSNKLSFDYLSSTIKNIINAPNEKVASKISIFNSSYFVEILKGTINSKEFAINVLKANDILLKCNTENKVNTLANILDCVVDATKEELISFIFNCCDKILNLDDCNQIEIIDNYIDEVLMFEYDYKLENEAKECDFTFHEQVIRYITENFSLDKSEYISTIFTSSLFQKIIDMNKEEYNAFFNLLWEANYSWQLCNISEIFKDNCTFTALKDETITYDNLLTLMSYATVYKNFFYYQNNVSFIDNNVPKTSIQQYIRIVKQMMGALGSKEEKFDESKSTVKKIGGI